MDQHGADLIEGGGLPRLHVRRRVVVTLAAAAGIAGLATAVVLAVHAEPSGPEAGPSTAATGSTPSSLPAGVRSAAPGRAVHGRLSLLLGHDRIEMVVPTVPGPTSPDRGGWTMYGHNLISRDATGLPDADVALYWTPLAGPGWARLCPGLIGYPSRLDPAQQTPTAAEAAADVASAPGTVLVSGPRSVTVGGHPATRVVVTVREDRGCDPGYFYAWPAAMGGAQWVRTDAGDTIRVWIVDMDGRWSLFIAAETGQDAPPDLEREVEEIVTSIHFG